MAIGDLIKKAKGYVQQNPDKAKQVLDKIETTVDKQTKGKYRDQIRKGSDAVGGALGVEKGNGPQGQGKIGDQPQAQPDPGQPQPGQQSTPPGQAPQPPQGSGADGLTPQANPPQPGQ